MGRGPSRRGVDASTEASVAPNRRKAVRMHITEWRFTACHRTESWADISRRQATAPAVLLPGFGAPRVAPWLLIATALLVGCGSPKGPEPSQEGASTGPVVEQPAGTPSAEQAGTAAQPNSHSTGPPKAVITTSLGKITIELDMEHAPLTVHNFLTYANAKHYDQTIFHFVEPEEMLLGGGFTADLKEKPTSVPIRNEAHNGLKNRRGTIAMSRSPESIDSATCQFFINLADNPKLDFRDRTPEEYGYCVFGRVVGGADVVDRIATTPTRDQGDFVSVPVTPVVIESVRLLP
jgi:cyclophilin family peptidyl-prolyl cis-trans isomerase